jgi:hypothetical protein
LKPVAAVEVVDEELAAVFQAVLGSRATWSAPQAAPKTRKADQKVSWAEYVDFVAGIASSPVTSAELEGTSDADGSVRSGDWLRHSAASSLYLLGQMLQEAAVVLEALGE